MCEKKKIDLVATLKQLGEVQQEINKLRSLNDLLKEDIEMAASDFFSPLRGKIARALQENMSKETVAQIKEQEEKELRRKASGIVVFEANRTFNPNKDSFVIDSVRFNEEHTKVKIEVECIKNREYLGISGCWLPETYETVWLDPKELVTEVFVVGKKTKPIE